MSSEALSDQYSIIDSASFLSVTRSSDVRIFISSTLNEIRDSYTSLAALAIPCFPLHQWLDKLESVDISFSKSFQKIPDH